MLWHYGLIGLVCLVIGYWIGARHARLIKRNALKELNTKSLELLEKKAKFKSLSAHSEEQERKDRLLKLTLKHLQQSNARLKQLRQLMVAQSQKHNSNETLLRLKAIKSHEKAVKATALARKATVHLKRLETASSAGASIKASDSKLVEDRAQATKSTAVGHHPRTPNEVVRSVSSRDSLRLAKLESSNDVPRRQR